MANAPKNECYADETMRFALCFIKIKKHTRHTLLFWYATSSQINF